MNVRRSLLAIAVGLTLILGLAALVAAEPGGRAAPPEGQIVIAVHVTLAPTWFDPAETPGVVTPFLTLYALHDGP